MDFPEDTATVLDPRGFPHVGHLTDQRDEESGTALYYAALTADDAFHAALVAEYGPVRAGDMRYRLRPCIDCPARVKEAYQAKLAADEAWRNEIDRRRAEADMGARRG